MGRLLALENLNGIDKSTDGVTEVVLERRTYSLLDRRIWLGKIRSERKELQLKTASSSSSKV